MHQYFYNKINSQNVFFYVHYDCTSTFQYTKQPSSVPAEIFVGGRGKPKKNLP